MSETFCVVPVVLTKTAYVRSGIVSEAKAEALCALANAAWDLRATVKQAVQLQAMPQDWIDQARAALAGCEVRT